MAAFTSSYGSRPHCFGIVDANAGRYLELDFHPSKSLWQWLLRRPVTPTLEWVRAAEDWRVALVVDNGSATTTFPGVSELPLSPSDPLWPLGYIRHKLGEEDPLQFLVAAGQVQWKDPLPRSEEYVSVAVHTIGDDIEMLIRTTENPNDWTPARGPHGPERRRVLLTPATSEDTELLPRTFPAWIPPAQVKQWSWQSPPPLPRDWHQVRRYITGVLTPTGPDRRT